MARLSEEANRSSDHDDANLTPISASRTEDFEKTIRSQSETAPLAPLVKSTPGFPHASIVDSAHGKPDTSKLQDTSKHGCIATVEPREDLQAAKTIERANIGRIQNNKPAPRYINEPINEDLPDWTEDDDDAICRFGPVTKKYVVVIFQGSNGQRKVVGSLLPSAEKPKTFGRLKIDPKVESYLSLSLRVLTTSPHDQNQEAFNHQILKYTFREMGFGSGGVWRVEQGEDVQSPSLLEEDETFADLLAEGSIQKITIKPLRLPSPINVHDMTGQLNLKNPQDQAQRDLFAELARSESIEIYSRKWAFLDLASIKSKLPRQINNSLAAEMSSTAIWRKWIMAEGDSRGGVPSMDFNRRVNYHQERLGTWPINCRETFTNAEQIFATLFEAAVREDEFIKNIFTAAENDKSMRAQICRVPHLSSLNQLDVVNHAASRNPSESDLPLTAERTPQPNDDANHPTEVMLYVNYYGNSKAKQVFRRGSSDVLDKPSRFQAGLCWIRVENAEQVHRRWIRALEGYGNLLNSGILKWERIFSQLLGHSYPAPRDGSIPDLIGFDDAQVQASLHTLPPEKQPSEVQMKAIECLRHLDYHIFCWVGPPGTGKTKTIACFCFVARDSKIMIVTPSNAAGNAVARMLLQYLPAEQVMRFESTGTQSSSTYGRVNRLRRLFQPQNEDETVATNSMDESLPLEEEPDLPALADIEEDIGREEWRARLAQMFKNSDYRFKEFGEALLKYAGIGTKIVAFKRPKADDTLASRIRVLFLEMAQYLGLTPSSETTERELAMRCMGTEFASDYALTSPEDEEALVEDLSLSALLSVRSIMADAAARGVKVSTDLQHISLWEKMIRIAEVDEAHPKSPLWAEFRRLWHENATHGLPPNTKVELPSGREVVVGPRKDFNDQIALLRDHTIRQQRVIVSTMSASFDKHLGREFQPSVVFLDEAGQAIEHDAWIPFVQFPDAHAYIFVGDIDQLRPVCQSAMVGAGPASQRASDEDEGQKRPVTRPLQRKADTDDGRQVINVLADQLETSLMARLLATGCPSFVLTEQHRSVPQIAAVVNSLTYHGKITNGPGTSLQFRPIARMFQGYVKEKHNLVNKSHLYINCTKTPLQREHGSTSRVNEVYANLIWREIEKMLDFGFRASDIAIVTPYAGQQRLHHARRTKLAQTDSTAIQIQIWTVNSSQGSEAPIVIVDLVVSKQNGPIRISKFVRDKHRLNVALSRARDGLIVVGDKTITELDTVVSSKDAKKGEKQVKKGHNEEEKQVKKENDEEEKQIKKDDKQTRLQKDLARKMYHKMWALASRNGVLVSCINKDGKAFGLEPGEEFEKEKRRQDQQGDVITENDTEAEDTWKDGEAEAD